MRRSSLLKPVHLPVNPTGTYTYESESRVDVGKAMRHLSSLFGVLVLLAVFGTVGRGQSAVEAPVPRAILQNSQVIDFFGEPPVLLAWSYNPAFPGQTLEIWNSVRWTIERKVVFRTKGFYRVDVRRNSTVLITAEDNTTRHREQFIVSIPDGATRRLDELTPYYVYSPNGRLRAHRPLRADGRPDSTRIVLERTDLGETLLDFVPFRLESRILGFSPDSRFLVYDGSDYPPRKKPAPEVLEHLRSEPPFRLWDTDAQREDERDIPGTRTSRFLGFTSDGKILMIAHASRIDAVDFATGMVLTWKSFRGTLKSAAMFEDGCLVAFGTPRSMTLWDYMKGAARSWSWNEPGGAAIVRLSPDRKWLITSEYRGHQSLVWSLESLMQSMVVDRHDAATCWDASP